MRTVPGNRASLACEAGDVTVLHAARDVDVAIAGLRTRLRADAECARYRLPWLPGHHQPADTLAPALLSEAGERARARERLELRDGLRSSADRVRPLVDMPWIDVDAERAPRMLDGRERQRRCGAQRGLRVTMRLERAHGRHREESEDQQRRTARHRVQDEQSHPWHLLRSVAPDQSDMPITRVRVTCQPDACRAAHGPA